jgi:hypothetical protein
MSAPKHSVRRDDPATGWVCVPYLQQYACRIRRAIFGLLLTSALAVASAQPRHNFIPEQGLVPTPEVAIRIAVAVWEPIYGSSNIERQKPFKAVLKDGVWYVEGSLPSNFAGGVAEAEIAQQDGKILRVSHGK